MAQGAPTELSDGVHYLPAAVNTFMVRTPAGGSILIDTGQDGDYARRQLKASRAMGLEPVAILNTHAHSDHFGGNAWLLKRLPHLQVYAARESAVVISNPVLQPLGLFHGASPLPELLQKWTHGVASPVHHVLEPGPVQIEGVQLELIDAAGHDRQQLAVLVDDVLLAADGLFGEALLSRYPMPFSHDVGKQLASVERLGEVPARLAVPGHGDPLPPDQLASINRQALQRVAAAVLEATQDPADQATVLARVCTSLGTQLADPVRYLLNFSTIAAWLGHFRSRELVECVVQGNQLIWQRRQLPYGDS